MAGCSVIHLGESTSESVYGAKYFSAQFIGSVAGSDAETIASYVQCDLLAWICVCRHRLREWLVNQFV